MREMRMPPSAALMRSLLAVALVTATLSGARATDGTVQLAVPGRANATPSIAALGDFVAVAWGATPPDGSADVFLAASRDGGRTFGAPVRVNADVGQARLGGEQPPRVALARVASGDPQIVVVWGARVGTSTGMHVARSTDGGKTFGAEKILQSSDVPGDRGWHTVAVDPEGTAHIVWLDHRRMAARPKGEPHDHTNGAAMAQMSSLYYATVKADGTVRTERDLLPGVCFCCKTAIATGPSGQVFSAWRHVYEGNLRDIAFTQSLDGGATFSPPARISEDNWVLAGCPDDGPAMAVDADGIVHIVWPTVIGGDEPTGAIFHASTKDGQRFTRRSRVPTHGSLKPSHPQIAIDGAGRIVVAWDEVVDGVRRAAAVTAVSSGPGLAFGTPRWLAANASTYPVMAATKAGILSAWTVNPGPNTVIAVARMQ